MKSKLILAFAALGLAFAPTLQADKKDKEKHKEHDHDHDHAHEKKEAGPSGGRVIFSVEPHFEFFVTEDRKVKITFLGEDKKAIAPAEQSVSAIGGERSKPTKLAFTLQEGALVSDQALPEGDMIPIVLTIKPAPGEKSVVEKFTINLSDCPTCDFKEYACTCDHDH